MAVAVNPTNPAQRVLSLQGSLFVLEADGSSRRLTDPYYDAREPQYSPDGSAVAFHGYRSGNWDIWQVPIDGSAPPSALTDDAFDDREPVYSSDGGSVLFASDRGGSYDIWQLDLASDALTQVTETQGNSYSPSVSDAGLAYVEQSAASALVTVKTAQGDEVAAEARGIVSGVQWRPDESGISFQVHAGDQTSMRMVTLESGSVQALSFPGDDVFPFKASWIGSDEVAYVANGDVMRRDLTSGDAAAWPFEIEVKLQRHDYQRRARDYSLDAREALGLTSPVISNDGKDIYFTALGDLWHWQPDAAMLNNLTNDPAADFSPALAPDGEQLAFVSDRTGRVGLHVLTLADGAIEHIPVRASQISMPSWSPDGERLAFFIDVPGNPLGGQLVILDLSTGEMTPVLAPMPAQLPSWSADGQKVAVTRLNPYSTRYREGMYELVIADISSGDTAVVAPEPHKSIVHAALTPDGAMTYVQGARLHRLELDEDYRVMESAGQMTQETTDMPAWSANGDYLVYLSGHRLMRMDLTTGGLQNITPDLSYTLAAPNDVYVLRAGRVFVSGDTSEYLLDQDIWINGTRIEKITPADPELTDVEIIDASDQTVVPGLFEMHAHMGETSEVQGRVWLAYGITTVRDPGSNPYVAKERQEAWDSGRRLGPRTHITGFLTDGNRVFYSMAEGIVSQTHLQDALQRTADLELDFIKTYVRLPDHWQATVVDFAHNLGIPVSSHELYPAVAHGMDHVEHIGGTSRRGYQPKVSRLGYSYQDVIALLSESGMGLTATAVLPGFAVIVAEEADWFETPQFDHFYGPQVRRGYELMVPRFGAAAASTAQANGGLLSALTKSGALLVTGTDAPFVPYGAGLHAEFRLYSRAGVSNADILKQATIRSAIAAGVDAELGTIEPGKLADLVVVDGDPLNDIRELDRVTLTIKNGFRYTLADLMEQP